LYGHLPIASSKSVKSAESAVPISESGLISGELEKIVVDVFNNQPKEL
jgi:hypothetical protein